MQMIMKKEKSLFSNTWIYIFISVCKEYFALLFNLALLFLEITEITSLNCKMSETVSYF